MKAVACCLAYVLVIIVGWPLSLVAAVLAHAADWLDDLSYKLLDGWLP
jgi:ABC-type antimicrobial peptide transport system permease subunit